MSSWKTNDPAWTDAREKEWSRIEPLFRFNVGTKNELKQIRTYFLTGKLSKNTKVELAHRLWMHPDRNEKAWGQIIEHEDSQNIWRAIKLIRRESQEAYMNGIDGPLLSFLLGPDHASGQMKVIDKILSNLDNINNLDNIYYNFFRDWTRRAFIWLIEPYDVDDCYCPYTIDLFFDLLDHVPEEYFSLKFYDPGEDIIDDKALYSLRANTKSIHYLFFLIAWFVEPRGLKGENTKIRQFAETMKRELDHRKLPPHVKKLWEFIKSGEDRFLRVWDLPYTLSMENYHPPVLYRAKPLKSPQGLVKAVHKVYEELGFAHDEFKPESIDTIELRNHLSEEFAGLLGYLKKSSIPAYRYRLNTTEAYVNSSRDRIDLDVIVFTHHKSLVWTKEVPMAMLLPRPQDKYLVNPDESTYQHSIYNLNFRLARRTLAALHQLEFLKIIIVEGDKRLQFFSGPLCIEPEPSFTIFVPGLEVMLNTPEDDFPILKDSPLPPLV